MMGGEDRADNHQSHKGDCTERRHRDRRAALENAEHG
jgi:hypothetical protein